MQKDFLGVFFICTAVKFKKEGAFFGRNLDLEFSYNEKIAVMPRNFPLIFKSGETMSTHFSMIGTAHISGGFPLFYDAVNEHGVFMAALNFPGEAAYFYDKSKTFHLAPFEVIPFVLSRCSNAEEAAMILKNASVDDVSFSEELPNTPLHWFLADRESCFVIEPLSTGISVKENPVEVLTNSPSFDFHLKNLANFGGISARETEFGFAENLDIKPFSRGSGTFSLPGGLDSCSRFIRAAFVKENSVCDEEEISSVTQFFHILSSVEQPKGCVRLFDGELEHTQYSSCADERGRYFYRTYNNSRICCIDIKKEHLDSSVLKIFPFLNRQDIFYQN